MSPHLGEGRGERGEGEGEREGEREEKKVKGTFSIMPRKVEASSRYFSSPFISYDTKKRRTSTKKGTPSIKKKTPGRKQRANSAKQRGSRTKKESSKSRGKRDDLKYEKKVAQDVLSMYSAVRIPCPSKKDKYARKAGTMAHIRDQLCQEAEQQSRGRRRVSRKGAKNPQYAMLYKRPQEMLRNPRYCATEGSQRVRAICKDIHDRYISYGIS